MPTPLRLLLAVGVMLALAPGVAQAAVGVTISPDPLEDRAITFTGTGDVVGRELFAKLRPASGTPCASAYKGETGTDVFFSDPIGTSELLTIEDPGAYVVCAYLQEYSSDATPASAATVPLTVRANSAALAVNLPRTASVDAAVPVVFSGSSELGRGLYAKVKPVGAGPCGQSFSADPSSDSIAYDLPATGPFSIPRLTGRFSAVGVYVVCAWLQERSSDALAEAAGAGIVSVISPLPVLTDLDVSPISFEARRTGPAITSNYPSTSISFRLNTNAQVRFTVKARRSGRRVGSSCRRPTRALRGRRVCARYVTVRGSFTVDATSGYNSLRFSGRLSGRRLALGRYRLYAAPRNATGAGATLRQSFRIIRG